MVFYLKSEKVIPEVILLFTNIFKVTEVLLYLLHRADARGDKRHNGSQTSPTD